MVEDWHTEDMFRAKTTRNEPKNFLLNFLQHNRLKDREGDESITTLYIIEVR